MNSARFAFVLFPLALVAACGSSDTSGSSSGASSDAGIRGNEATGQACTQASQCYANLEGGTVSGRVTCITKVANGYCTHTCTQDSECCSTPGECLTGVKQVCSPFENQAVQYCLLSCEDSDVQSAIAANREAGYYDGGTTDAGSVADAYCQSFAGASTSCRSSGGGSKNRKVCIPKT